MNSETMNCQNCKKDFVIEPDDFSFYEKIKVPPPTFCSECRLQRRLSFRNEKNLHWVICGLCKKKTLSVISNKNLKSYCVSCWVSEKWDPMDYGKDYDFSSNFFKQYEEMMISMPNRSLASSSSSLINSEYSNTSSNLKDCYLVYGSDNCENCMYCSEVFESFDCVDSKIIMSSTSCFNSVNCQRCSHVNNSIDCRDSFDVYYSRNLSGCSNCFGCSNLSNKSYYIFNEPFTKEDYSLVIKQYNNGSYLQELNNKKITREFLNKFPVKYYHGFKNINITGDYVYNSKNSTNSFNVTGAENCKYCFNLVVNSSKDCLDYSDWGANVENIYESLSCGNNVSNLKFCLFVGKNSMDNEYSAHCANCQNVFGCIGLRNKQYCILNKQFTKNEYFKLKEQIINNMNSNPYIDKKGCVYKYGEFFPTENSIFPYNQSTAQDFFLLTKKEVEDKGYIWTDSINKNYLVDIKTKDIPDNTRDARDNIVGTIIECLNEENNPNCTRAFKINPNEFSFYKKENIPLPRLCPNCRHFERSKKINPPKLWHRSCMKEGCTNEFETSYSPDRPEIVYCEKCYQQEVY